MLSRLPAALTAGSLVALALVVPAPASASAPPAHLTVPGAAAPGVIVGWRDDADEADREAALRRVGLRPGEDLPLVDGEVAPVLPGTAQAVADRLEQDPAVAYAEPDAPLRVSALDPHLTLQWGAHNTGQDGGVADVDIDLPEAWAALPAARTPVVVAVIDTGIDLEHPDLSGSAWSNPGEIAGNGVDDDGNGHVDDVHGWDFVHDDATTYDAADGDRHGTHVAGTLAASVDNGIGVAGVARDVQLMALKAIGPESGTTSDAIAALAYARSHGATIVNASWGGPGRSQSLSDAIAASGMLMVAAAGNGGQDGIGDDLAVSPQYPAAFRLPNLVSVAAVDRRGLLAGYSNYGVEAVDVGAPGSSTPSTVPGAAYARMSGTSMAAPHVSGVAALLAAVAPQRTSVELRELLRSTAVPLASLAGRTSTGGLVNAEAAVRAVVAPPPPEPSPEPPPPSPEPPVPTEEPPAEPPADENPTPTEPVACPVDLPSAGFLDVALDSVHSRTIDCAVWWSFAGGVGDSRFGPTRQVTRAQMASFLAAVAREAGLLPVGAPDRFSDDDGTVHEANTDALAELGVVKGTGERAYSPDAPVTRAQMATFLVALQERLTGTPMEALPTPFSDVEGTHRTSIEKAYAAGLTAGVSATEFGASRLVRRDQIATFLINEVEVLVREGHLAPPG